MSLWCAAYGAMAFAWSSPMTGRLVYVLGPSGAGKDTLLNYARAQLAGSPVLFAHRYITRPPIAGDENFVSLSEREFEVRLPLLAFHWRAHGHRYGVGMEVEHWRNLGHAVVVSGSRAHFSDFLAADPNVTPVLITATPALLAKRLAGRNREDKKNIAERLLRGATLDVTHPNLERVENSGNVEEAGERLVAIIRNCAADTGAAA